VRDQGGPGQIIQKAKNVRVGDKKQSHGSVGERTQVTTHQCCHG
jgi:hypothetical protein